jgi:hypothetical protein
MATSQLNTHNPNQLDYTNKLIKIAVLGGIRLDGLDRMRVTVKIQSTEVDTVAVRHNLDLYNDTQVEKLIRKTATKLEIGTSVIEASINELIETLEKYRLEHLANDKVDFFNRESFFLFMTDSKYDNFYDSVYLIEIEKKEGERNLSKKILLISYNKEVTLLAFKKAIKWEQVALSQNEVNRYTSSNLKKSTKVNEGEYFITTKIIGNKF